MGTRKQHKHAKQSMRQLHSKSRYDKCHTVVRVRLSRLRPLEVHRARGQTNGGSGEGIRDSDLAAEPRGRRPKAFGVQLVEHVVLRRGAGGSSQEKNGRLTKIQPAINPSEHDLLTRKKNAGIKLQSKYF